jgi:lysophospholipase L1-like esterase
VKSEHAGARNSRGRIRAGWSCVTVCLSLLGGLLPARGELVLANFSAANPIKAMFIGDSITDDCVFDGAWRKYLQPLLVTNGYPYLAQGRNLSFPTAGFSNNRHEGYCGTVIAPPGVYGPVHGYNPPDAYLLRIVADALTNAAPNLVLILMGANDIGRGRNPYQVATNDMPNLLNVIFAKVPDANVVLAKTTTLQNAGLGYNAYATNVPIYNAALQSMVNQRRALGQNVFLADMFSAVDYDTMFNSDHLHPNVNGLRAIAGEWTARLQCLTIRTGQFTSVFINGGAEWKYSDTGQDLGTNWVQPGFEDSGWSSGIARLGYGDPATATVVSFGAEPTNKFVTTYFRRPFVVPWNAVTTNLNFRLARADGAAVWLNGTEVFRTNLPSGPIAYSNLALTAMTGYTAHVFYPVNLPVSNLPAGTNLLAVEIHQSSVTNSTLGFDMELIGSGYLLPAPLLSITQTGGEVRLSWPRTNGGGFTLYSTTNLAASASWTMTTTPAQTNGGEIFVTQAPDASTRFFRLQQP